MVILQIILLVSVLFLGTSCTTFSWFVDGTQKENIHNVDLGITIDSEPKDVKVYINSKYLGNTPLNTKLSYQRWGNYKYESLREQSEWDGSINWNKPPKEKRRTLVGEDHSDLFYEVVLYKEGYVSQTNSIRVGPNQRRTHLFVLVEQQKPTLPGHQQQQQQQLIIQGSPIGSYLQVSSDPSEADVYVDDAFVGKTPVTGFKAKAGVYQLRIVKGNKSWQSKILIPEDGTLKIEAVLK